MLFIYFVLESWAWEKYIICCLEKKKVYFQLIFTINSFFQPVYGYKPHERKF